MVPDPVELVGKLKPENSKVCDVAKLDIFISEAKVLATDGVEIVIDDAVVFPEEVTNFVLFLKTQSSAKTTTSFKIEANAEAGAQSGAADKYYILVVDTF